MTALDDAAALAVDVTFRSRISAASGQVAQIIGEAVLALPAPNGTDKARYLTAVDVLRNPADWTDRFAWAVATSVGFDLVSYDDSDVIFAIDALWNLVAGLPI